MGAWRPGLLALPIVALMAGAVALGFSALGPAGGAGEPPLLAAEPTVPARRTDPPPGPPQPSADAVARPPAATAAPSAAGTPAAPPAVAAVEAARSPTPAAAAPRVEALAWETDTDALAHDAALALALDELVRGAGGHVGLAVKDLGSGRGVLLNGADELPAASLFKLPVLYSVFRAGVPLSEPLEITERIKSFDLGTLELEVGETLTVAEALERMVTISDNGSAILLADRVGPTRVNADLAALGLASSHYLADRLTTSARDMLVLLERMARGQAVAPAASAEMVHLLLRQRINDRLPSRVPAGVRVAHKTGNLAGVVNDVGILYGPRQTVVVATLVADAADEAAAAQAIAQVAERAYRYFDALPQAAPGPAVPPLPRRPIPPVRREPSPAPVPSSVPAPVASPAALGRSAANALPRAGAAPAPPQPSLARPGP